MSSSSLILVGALFGIIILQASGIRPRALEDANKGLSNYMTQMGNPRDWFKTQKSTKPEEWKRGESYPGTRGGTIMKLVSPVTRALGLDKKSPPTTKQKPGFQEQTDTKKTPETELFKPLRQITGYSSEFFAHLNEETMRQGGYQRERRGLIEFDKELRDRIREGFIG